MVDDGRLLPKLASNSRPGTPESIEIFSAGNGALYSSSAGSWCGLERQASADRGTGERTGLRSVGSIPAGLLELSYYGIVLVNNGAYKSLFYLLFSTCSCVAAAANASAAPTSQRRNGVATARRSVFPRVEHDVELISRNASERSSAASCLRIRYRAPPMPLLPICYQFLRRRRRRSGAGERRRATSAANRRPRGVRGTDGPEFNRGTAAGRAGAGGERAREGTGGAVPGRAGR